MPYGRGDLIQNENFSILINKITGNPIPSNSPIFGVPQGRNLFWGYISNLDHPGRGKSDFHAYEYDTPF